MLSQIKVNNEIITSVDNEPTENSDNLIISGGVDEKIKKINPITYTSSAKINKAIKEIYCINPPSDYTTNRYYLNRIGYYAPNNWFYCQLKNGDGTIVDSFEIDYDTFDGFMSIRWLNAYIDKSVFLKREDGD